MTTAALLQTDAGQAFDRLQTLWVANLMKQKIQIFCATSLPLFSDQTANDHPVINWLSVFSSLGNLMANSNVPITQLNTAAQYLYRTCWMTSFLVGAGLITNAQGLGVHGNYIGNF